MSKRSEEAALRLYPESSGPMERSIFEDRRVILACRRACEEGYEQAEKDLADAFQAEYAKELARADFALTWKDIRLICEIDEDMHCHSDWPLRGQEVYYEEVLRRFREMKNK